jgi:hypothetical protein
MFTKFGLESGGFDLDPLGAAGVAINGCHVVSTVTDLDVPMFTIDEGDWPRRTQSERRRGLMPAAFLR